MTNLIPLSRTLSITSTLCFVLILYLFLCATHGMAKEVVSKINVKDWQYTTPEQQGMSSSHIHRMINEVRTSNLPIDSITIVRNGTLVTDAYFYPFKKGVKHMLHSNTKSIVSALVGIALEKGYLKSLDQPVHDFFPHLEQRKTYKENGPITIAHLLTMSSGLCSKDTYQDKWLGMGDLLQSSNWAHHILAQKQEYPPGKTFKYSNGSSYLLTTILQKATHISTVEFAQNNLFEPMGITDFYWPVNSEGLAIGWGGILMKPLDMAKFGLLYLQGGKWGGNQLVPAYWVKRSTQKHMNGSLFDGYGYQWWTDPGGYYMAVGFRGQFIFVVEKEQLVVVFTSNDLNKDNFYLPKQLLEKHILPSVISNSPLPENLVENRKLTKIIQEIATPPSSGFVWTSKEEGIADKGVFLRTASPAFTFTYPDTSTYRARTSNNQLLLMRTVEGDSFSVSVRNIPLGASIFNVGIEDFVHSLQDVGSNISVTGNKEITLRDGSKAYRTDLDWQWQSSFIIKTILVSSFRQGKWVQLAYNIVNLGQDSMKERIAAGSAVVESLCFQ